MEPQPPSYDERLTAPPVWWLIVALAALSCAIIALPFGGAVALGTLAASGVAVGGAVSAYGSARVRVVRDSLVAGEARIPVRALGRAHVLGADEAAAWRSHRADPRAFMLLRAYIPTALRVEIDDPLDPTPYVYLSTRRPHELALALESARAGSPSGGT